MPRTIGIDFGTAFCSAAAWVDVDGERPGVRMLARIPAVVRMLHGGGTLAGEAAFAARSAYALSTVDQIKRFLGRPHAEVIDSEKQIAWTLQRQPGDPNFLIDAWTTVCEPETVAAAILKAVKAQAEDVLQERVEAAVLTVPAAATNMQRLALKEAARRAGLVVLRIINEPSAIAIAEAHLRPAKLPNERWAIVNFGAGMTDVAIVQIGSTGVAVQAAAGDTNLGLAQVRERLVEQLEARFRKRTGVSFDPSRQIAAELIWIAEESLQALSAGGRHRVDLRGAGCRDGGQSVDLDETLTLQHFESALRPALRRLRELALEALRRAGCATTDLTRVLLCGGGVFVPFIHAAVAGIFRTQPNIGGTGSDACHTRAVIGAGLLAASLEGHADVQMQDVLAQSLGITLVNDRFSPLLPAGCQIPANKTGMYTTVSDDQESINFEVREGDDLRASHNRMLGEFTLRGIRRARASEPQVRVTFNIDESGILSVNARDTSTQSQQDVIIEHHAGNGKNVF